MATGKGLRLEKNITGKSSAMKTQFSTNGILMDKYIQSKKFYFLILSSILFLLGALTKENAVSWFIVEFMLIWQIYFLTNKSPQIFT